MGTRRAALAFSRRRSIRLNASLHRALPPPCLRQRRTGQQERGALEDTRRPHAHRTPNRSSDAVSLQPGHHAGHGEHRTEVAEVIVVTPPPQENGSCLQACGIVRCAELFLTTRRRCASTQPTCTEAALPGGTLHEGHRRRSLSARGVRNLQPLPPPTQAANRNATADGEPSRSAAAGQCTQLSPLSPFPGGGASGGRHVHGCHTMRPTGTRWGRQAA